MRRDRNKKSRQLEQRQLTMRDPDDFVTARIVIRHATRQGTKVVAAQTGISAENMYGILLDIALGLPDIGDRVRTELRSPPRGFLATELDTAK